MYNAGKKSQRFQRINQNTSLNNMGTDESSYKESGIENPTNTSGSHSHLPLRKSSKTANRRFSQSQKVSVIQSIDHDPRSEKERVVEDSESFFDLQPSALAMMTNKVKDFTIVGKEKKTFSKMASQSEKLPDINLMQGPLVSRKVSDEIHHSQLSENAMFASSSPEQELESRLQSVRQRESNDKPIIPSLRGSILFSEENPVMTDMEVFTKDVNDLMGLNSFKNDSMATAVMNVSSPTSTSPPPLKCRPLTHCGMESSSNFHVIPIMEQPSAVRARRLKGLKTKEKSERELPPVVSGHATSWKSSLPPPSPKEFLPNCMDKKICVTKEMVAELRLRPDNFPGRVKVEKLLPLELEKPSGKRTGKKNQNNVATTQSSQQTLEAIKPLPYHQENKLPSIAPRCTSPKIITQSTPLITPKDIYGRQKTTAITPKEMYSTKKYDNFSYQPKASFTPFRTRFVYEPSDEEDFEA